MTDPRPVSNEAILHELLPSVEKALDRHVAATVGVVPPRLRPLRRGAQLRAGAVAAGGQPLPDVAQTALEVNLLTEDNLPYYHLALWRTFGERRGVGRVGAALDRRGGASRHRAPRLPHGHARRRSGACWNRAGWTRRCGAGTRSSPSRARWTAWSSPRSRSSPRRISHRNTGEITDDETAQKLCARVATDENFHYVFYRDMAIEAIELDPSAMVMAMHRQILNFAMPGAGIPGFRQKAKAMANAGIYNLRIHLEQVLRPVLENHFRLAQIDGLERCGQAGARGDLRAPGTPEARGRPAGRTARAREGRHLVRPDRRGLRSRRTAS